MKLPQGNHSLRLYFIKLSVGSFSQLSVVHWHRKRLQMDQIRDTRGNACYPARQPPHCLLRRIQIVIVALILILAGSFCGAVLTWLQGAGPLHIMLGYVGGGWIGFLGGMPVLLAVQMIRCRLLRARQDIHGSVTLRATQTHSGNLSDSRSGLTAARPPIGSTAHRSRHRVRTGARHGAD